MRVTFLARNQFGLTMAALFLTVSAWAGDTPRDRASLKNISAMQVGVEKIQSGAERDGLTRSQTQTDIETRLRQSGITLDPSSPYLLYVAINTVRDPASPSYAYNVAVTFHQGVSLPRSPKSQHLAATWSVSRIGLVSVDHLRDVRSEVADLVNQFISAYREQNAKQ